MFLNLLLKDIKTIVYDVKSLAIILFMPIVLMSILGASLQGVFGNESESGVFHLDVAIVEEFDQAEQMYKVEGRIDRNEYDETAWEQMNPLNGFYEMMDDDALKEIVSYTVTSEEEAYQLLKDEAIAAIIFLPKDFIYNQYMMLAGGRNINEIVYVVDPDRDFFAQVVYGIIRNYADMTNHIYAQSTTVIKAMSSAGVPIENIDVDGFEFDRDQLNAITINKEYAVKGDYVNSFQYYAAAIMCMFLLYSAGIGGRSLLQERKEHTVPRLAVSGTTVYLIAASNFVRVMLLVMLQSLVMIGYSSIVLKVYWGDWKILMLTMLLSGFAIAGLGTLIAIITLISDNYRVANAFEFGVVYLMALVGGSYIPVEGLPEGLQKMGFLSLNGQALKLYLGAMGNSNLADYMSPIFNMLSFGGLFIAVSIVLLIGKGRRLVC